MLAWLQILAPENKDMTKPLVIVEDVVTQHLKTYGKLIIAVGTLREWIG